MRTLTGISRIVRLAVFASAAGLMASVIFASPVTGLPARAPVTPTPTPTPTPEPIPVRKVGWLNSAAARAPQGLQRTVALSGMAAGVPTFAPESCWRRKPRHGSSTDHQSWSMIPMIRPTWKRRTAARILIPMCASSSRTHGEHLGTSSHWRSYVFRIRSATTSPEGTYHLTIATRTGRYEAAISMYQYSWPRLYLWDVATLSLQTDFAPGQSMFADYYGFAPGARLEVGFYRTVPGGLKQTLIDLWQAMIDQGGRFVETLPIPATAPLGEYALIACDLAACKAYLDRMNSQLAANVFWEEFAVTYSAECQQYGRSGLPLWSTLSAGAEAGRCCSGEAVKVREGPINSRTGFGIGSSTPRRPSGVGAG